jgi:hypothetical protein
MPSSKHRENGKNISRESNCAIVSMSNWNKEYASAETPVVADLRAAGINVESVWDLVNDKDTYAPALPILLNHLQRSYPDARAILKRIRLLGD